jgi:hypothetical protein
MMQRVVRNWRPLLAGAFPLTFPRVACLITRYRVTSLSRILGLQKKSAQNVLDEIIVSIYVTILLHFST